jgi:CheY-like chemotaxis protein
MKHTMPRILCVDDEPLNLSLLEAMLSPRGYAVVPAADGFEALERIRTERIDICLLDVMMPGMDGFEVCRRIKSDTGRGNLPVVIITSFADSTGVDTGRSSPSMNLDHKLAFSDSANPIVVFYNETDAELAASTLVGELAKQLVPISNLVRYANDSFCLISLNYGREVT